MCQTRRNLWSVLAWCQRTPNCQRGQPPSDQAGYPPPPSSHSCHSLPFPSVSAAAAHLPAVASLSKCVWALPFKLPKPSKFLRFWCTHQATPCTPLHLLPLHSCTPLAFPICLLITNVLWHCQHVLRIINELLSSLRFAGCPLRMYVCECVCLVCVCLYTLLFWVLASKLVNRR